MRVLIIDDEMNICLTLKNIMEDEKYDCEYALNSKNGLEKVDSFHPDIILLDVRLDGANGIDVLKQIKENNPNIIVIMISGHSGIKEAVQAMRLGAYDFLEKPLSLTKIKVIIKKALEYKNIKKDYNRLKNDVSEQYKIIGESEPIQEMLSMIQKVAPSDSKVLIRGESGTGKELVAYAVHHLSNRVDKPFVKFNSAAIPNELVESELFGFEKGAFTGAVKSKDGKIEQADGGTLFLDEIGDMNLNAQAKILRVIQEGEFERVGGNKTQKIDVRIIAATHKNLEELVESGSFREDLYYRLNVIPIITPPLRHHPADIPLLINHYANYFAKDLNLPLKVFHPETIKIMQSWQYKGNVRELRNYIERIYILVSKQNIEPEDIEFLGQLKTSSNFWNETMNYKEKKKEFETKYLSTQLKMHDNNVSQTAADLGLQVSNLSRKFKELNIK
ncbi:MAG: sigma-54 dependent transcriptional regulator [Candidatus Cloacimonetes bacterium]|nr:sigma-54 dependent transcriptional regulator [Candidatus Cloacimonadota bacterium]MCF7815285.1 sigma-54 dependent transcriptional regulator [Candidatus Cloacimonadota bacterium]MCF7869416.1 sigma-54 dependent transcriptional regulator [Candidatus Cloacimonadota bacterium]MCF7884810.1 sigma-54 dependent transcriptional regulator [Candidatus Cloacimonadota bacterium]